MSEGNGRATIREVRDIADRIEDKIDALDAKYEKRMDSFDTWRAYLTGALAVITFGFSTALVFVRF